ncbi:DNA endonuclease SmrA [Marinomonas primoryensis]|uniref:SmrA superfamily protein n=1 Tax=Marinomonas primoryensis TaxID=178399 RepID=A0A859D036_9GAMM|nr:DNA endonuclease SmrA [Marinomonas primoryensis]QKK82326.1 SmrA superfamily protein [Marinomonas primoryensis]
MSDEDDTSLFAQEVAGIKPLKKYEVYLRKKGPQVDFHVRKQAASIAQEADRNHLSHDFVEKVEPNDVLGYKRSGVQDGVFKRLRQGKYGIEARLDLHRHTVAQAREQVYQFADDCMRNDIRVAIIVHGKGDRTPEPENQAMIKSYINKWLRDLDVVMAFHSAQRHHGDLGAVYVLFKKTEKARLEDWEKHQKR